VGEGGGHYFQQDWPDRIAELPGARKKGPAQEPLPRRKIQADAYETKGQLLWKNI
jgi:hypothetical protein